MRTNRKIRNNLTPKQSIMRVKIFIATLISLTLLISCSSENDSELSTPIYLYPAPVLEWGAPISAIKSQLTHLSFISDKGLTEHTNNVIVYLSIEPYALFSYCFKDHSLTTVTVFIKASEFSKQEILQSFNGYERIPDLGEEVFFNQTSNTLGEISTIYRSDTEYYCIGWSKIDIDVAEPIDLGLSVKWANVNIDNYNIDCAACCTHNKGNLVHWGDPTGEKLDAPLSSYPNLSEISATIYDIARAKWGGKWRVPTRQEMDELINACTWEWTTIDDISGYKVIGPNGNSIFLPTTGYQINTTIYNNYNSQKAGYYWTSTHPTQNNIYPYTLIFKEGTYRINDYAISGIMSFPFKNFGCAIRPVLSE